MCGYTHPAVTRSDQLGIPSSEVYNNYYNIYAIGQLMNF